MTTMQWVSTIILIAWPLLWHLAYPIGKLLEHKLPSRQREVLEQFASIAVRNVEQVSMNSSNAAKKQVAMSLLVQLFRGFHIPLPPEEILDGAIEATVYMLPSAKIVDSVPPGKPGE